MPFSSRAFSILKAHSTGNADKGALLCQALAAAHSSTPAESHVTSLSREGSAIWATFDISLRVEPVRIWEFTFVMMDGPDISLHPGVLGYQPALCPVSTIPFRKEGSEQAGLYFIVVILDRRVRLPAYDSH